jgi:hypothetical protein
MGGLGGVLIWRREGGGVHLDERLRRDETVGIDVTVHVYLCLLRWFSSCALMAFVVTKSTYGSNFGQICITRVDHRGKQTCISRHSCVQILGNNSLSPPGKKTACTLDLRPVIQLHGSAIVILGWRSHKLDPKARGVKPPA